MAQTFKPREPYFFGGHNQRTARKASAEYIKHLGIKTEKSVPQRFEKRAIKHYDTCKTVGMCKLPRHARKLVLTWAQEEVRSVASVLAGFGCQ